MKERYAELARIAQEQLYEANERYENDLLDIFPIGSIWWCTHGSRKSYQVKIKDFCLYSGGFVVENINTGKRKRVYWSTLLKQEATK